MSFLWVQHKAFTAQNWALNRLPAQNIVARQWRKKKIEESVVPDSRTESVVPLLSNAWELFFNVCCFLVAGRDCDFSLLCCTHQSSCWHVWGECSECFPLTCEVLCRLLMLVCFQSGEVPVSLKMREANSSKPHLKQNGNSLKLL